MKNTQENTVHTALSAVGHFFGELGCSLAKGLRKFFSNSKTIVGFAILVFFVLVAIFGPLLFPYNSDTDMANSYLMPSWEHPFGTDWLGRDVFRQVIAGTGSVLEIAFYSAVFTVVIGTVLGIVSGYLGGWVDKVIMAVTNIFLSIPSFPIYLLLAAIVTINTPVSLSVIISIWSWAGLCRAVRVQMAGHIIGPLAAATEDVYAVALDGPAHVLRKADAPQRDGPVIRVGRIDAVGHHRAQRDVLAVRGQREPVVHHLPHSARGPAVAEAEKDVAGILVQDLVHALRVVLEPFALLEDVPFLQQALFPHDAAGALVLMAVLPGVVHEGLRAVVKDEPPGALDLQKEDVHGVGRPG